MKNRIAKLLRHIANKLSPEMPTEYLTPIKTDCVEFKRFCVGHSLPKGQSCLNFDYLRPNLARLIGVHLLKENMIHFSIEDKSRDMNIIRAEVLAARPPEENFQ